MNANQQHQSPGMANNDAGADFTAEGNRMLAPDKTMEHLWRYFALHAQQRVSVFNFFVVLSGVISAAIGGALQAGKPLSIVVCVLGLLLPLLSFVFWRLDQRNSDLIKISERALRAGEESCLPEYARIFLRESTAGTAAAHPDDRAIQTRWTFRRSFQLIFVVMGFAGILASGFATYRLIFESAVQPQELKRAEAPSMPDPKAGAPQAVQINPPTPVDARGMESSKPPGSGALGEPAFKPRPAPNVSPSLKN